MKSLSSNEMSLLTIVRSKSAKHLYLEYLRDFVRYVLSWLKEIYAKLKMNHVLTETEFHGLFIDLIVLFTDILKFQTDLEKGLLSKEFDLYSLYEVFLDKISKDLAFFDDYNIVTTHINDLMKENKIFSNLVSSNPGYTNKSNILYYFYLPYKYIIRLARYFRIILLNTNRSSMLHSELMQLFDNSLYICKQIKGSIEQSGNRTMLISIEERLKGKYPIVELHRIYLFEKSVKIINKEELSRYLYLFSDLIVICTQSSTSSNISFECACESIPESPTYLLIYGIEQSFIIIFPSLDSKSQWEEAISQSLTHSYSNEKLHLDKVTPAPLFVNINTAKSCNLCKNTFGLLQRKYHCNKCGLIVCQQCFIKKPDRICKDCNDNPNKATNSRKQRLKDSLDKNDVSTVPRHLSRRASSYSSGLQSYFIPMKRNTAVERDFINRSLKMKSYHDNKKIYKIHKIKHIITINDDNTNGYKNDYNGSEIDTYYLQRLHLENYKHSNRSSADSYQSDRLSDMIESRSRFSSVSTALTPLIVEWIDNPLFDPMSNMKCKISYTFIKDKNTLNDSGSMMNNSSAINGSISHMSSYRQKQQSQRQRAITEAGPYNLTGSLSQSMSIKRSNTQLPSPSKEQQFLLQSSMKSSTSSTVNSSGYTDNNNNTMNIPRMTTAPIPSSLSSSTPLTKSSSNTRIRSGSGCISPKLLSPSHSNKHINMKNKNNPWDFLDGTLNPVISSSPIHKSPLHQPQQSPFPPPPFIKRKSSNINLNSVPVASGGGNGGRFRSKTIAIQPDEGKDIYDVGSSSESYKEMFLPNHNRNSNFNNNNNGMRVESKSISLGATAKLSSGLNTSNMHHLPPTVQLAMASYMFDADTPPDKHKKVRKRARSSRKTFG